MSLPLIIIGAGGHASVVLCAVQSLGAGTIEVTDRDHAKWGTSLLGVPVVGGDECILRRIPGTVLLVNGLGCADREGITRRTALYLDFLKRGYTFQTVIHPDAQISAHTRIQGGAQVMAGAVVQPRCDVGENSIINTSASIDHGCTIGAHSHIAPGAVLCGSVVIGEKVLVGAGVTIMPGVRVGARAVVGAGSLVLKDVLEGRTVMGVPARERAQ